VSGRQTKSEGENMGEEPEKTEKTGDQKTILVVDDEPNILKLVQYILEKNGHKVIAAYVGMEGIQMARDHKPHLIVLDIMMPNLSGFEAAKILAEDESTKDIPILMLSSKAQFEDKMQGLECGAVDYITKPFNRDELLQKVSSILASGKPE